MLTLTNTHMASVTQVLYFRILRGILGHLDFRFDLDTFDFSWRSLYAINNSRQTLEFNKELLQGIYEFLKSIQLIAFLYSIKMTCNKHCTILSLG